MYSKLPSNLIPKTIKEGMGYGLGRFRAHILKSGVGGIQVLVPMYLGKASTRHRIERRLRAAIMQARISESNNPAVVLIATKSTLHSSFNSLVHGCLSLKNIMHHI